MSASFLPLRRRNSLKFSEHPRPLGANTLTRFVHPAGSVQRKRLPPERHQHQHCLVLPDGQCRKIKGRTMKVRPFPAILLPADSRCLARNQLGLRADRTQLAAHRCRTKPRCCCGRVPACSPDLLVQHFTRQHLSRFPQGISTTAAPCRTDGLRRHYSTAHSGRGRAIRSLNGQGISLCIILGRRASALTCQNLIALARTL